MEALLFAVALFAVLVVAPIVSSIVMFFRTRALRADVDALRERVRVLEGASDAWGARSAPSPRDADSAAIEARPAAPPPLERPRPVAPVTPDRPAAPVAAVAPLAPPVARGPEPDAVPESLESRIGGRWLLNIGIAAIVIGVAYFEKLAIDNNWIGETARVIQGGIFGAVLVYAGGRFARAGYAAYGQMIVGGGIAVMYVSTYAAFNYYRLIDRPTAFVLLVAITALGAVLADRHNSQGLAILAVGGGFATPFLLPGNTDAQLALFTYNAILIAGTVYLAGRRNWPFLHLVSYVSTLITVAAWADRFYEPSKYLRTELFLTLFCAMFVAIAVRCRRDGEPLAQAAALILWTAPVAYYLASLVVLEPHAVPLLVWLICVMLVGGVLSVRTSPWAGLVVWMAVAAPFLAWTKVYNGRPWLVPGLATMAAVYVISLSAQLRIMTSSDRLPSARPAEIVWLHLNGLLMFASAYFLVEDTHLALTGPLAALFAVWHGVLAAGMLRRYRDDALQFAALAFSLLSIAVALQFDGPAVTVGWAVEGAAIVALGLHERREWMRAGGAILFAIAVVRALELLVTVAPANHVVLLNPRAASAGLVIALSYLLAWLHRRQADAGGTDIATAGAAGIVRAPVATALVVAQLVTVVLLTTEIRAYFAVRNSPFAREFMTSVTWAAYANALVLVGLYRRYAPIRYFGIALFGITILKVFFSDLAHVQQIYRVLSVMGLGALLLLTSYLYQRMRGMLTADAPGPGERAP